MDVSVDPPMAGGTPSHAESEACWRYGTPMEWRHATLQCPRSRFKIGCCEGTTAECERG